MSRFPSVPLTTGVPFFAVVSFNKGALARKGQIVILGIAGETRCGLRVRTSRTPLENRVSIQSATPSPKPHSPDLFRAVGGKLSMYTNRVCICVCIYTYIYMARLHVYIYGYHIRISY